MNKYDTIKNAMVKCVFIEQDGDYCHECFKRYGSFSPTEVIFLASLLQEDDNVLEIGAYVGSHCIPLSQFNEKGKIYCFEPQQDIYQRLVKNIELNNRKNIIPFNHALGKDNKIIKYKNKVLHDNNRGAFALYQLDCADDAQYSLSIKNIAEFTEINELSKLKLIKMDVESMEYEVIQTLDKILDKYHPILFIEYSPETFFDLCNYVAKFEYKIFWFNTSNNQYDLFTNVENNTVSMGDINIVCFPNDFEKIPSYLKQVKNFNYSLADAQDNILSLQTVKESLINNS